METGTHVVNHQDLYNFVLAGKSQFTLHNKESDGRFTYKVTKAKQGTAYFINVAYGYQQYMYAGMLVKSEKKIVEFIRGKKGKLEEESPSIKVLLGMIRMAHLGKLKEKYECLHFNKCGRCGKPLTDPVSIERGIGPECRKIMGMTNK